MYWSLTVLSVCFPYTFNHLIMLFDTSIIPRKIHRILCFLFSRLTDCLSHLTGRHRGRQRELKASRKRQRRNKNRRKEGRERRKEGQESEEEAIIQVKHRIVV